MYPFRQKQVNISILEPMPYSSGNCTTHTVVLHGIVTEVDDKVIAFKKKLENILEALALFTG